MAQCNCRFIPYASPIGPKTSLSSSFLIFFYEDFVGYSGFFVIPYEFQHFYSTYKKFH